MTNTGHFVRGLLAVMALACREPRLADDIRNHAGPDSGRASAVVDSVAVRRPTVVAYFVVPAGAVDTMPSLAVEADDWNYAMSILGDSLQASGISFAMTTQPRLYLQLGAGNGSDTTISLGAALSAGYVFARPGGRACVHRGAADHDVVMRAARAYAAGGAPDQLCRGR